MLSRFPLYIYLEQTQATKIKNDSLSNTQPHLLLFRFPLCLLVHHLISLEI